MSTVGTSKRQTPVCVCVCLCNKEQKSRILTYSEVGGCQRVCGVAILTDDGGGVPLLTVVVASASYAGHFANSGCEDHLDPSCMITDCCRKYGEGNEGEGKQKRSGYSLIHWKLNYLQAEACHSDLTGLQSKHSKKKLLCNFQFLKNLRMWILFQTVCLSVLPPSLPLLNPTAPVKCEREEMGKKKRTWERLANKTLGFCPILHQTSMRGGYRASFQNRPTGYANFSFCALFFLLLRFNFPLNFDLRFALLCSECRHLTLRHSLLGIPCQSQD